MASNESSSFVKEWLVVRVLALLKNG